MPSTPRSSSPRSGTWQSVSVNPRNNTLHPFMPARAVPNVVGPFKVKQANGMIYRGCLGIYRKRLCFSIVPIPCAVRFIEDAPAVARMPTARLDHKRIREAQDFVSVHVRSHFKVIAIAFRLLRYSTPPVCALQCTRLSRRDSNCDARTACSVRVRSAPSSASRVVQQTDQNGTRSTSSLSGTILTWIG